jgi:hypothetical protein
MRGVFGLFWFWCGALWMVLLVTWIRPRLAEAVHHDRITSDEASAFLRGLGISIALLFGTLGVIVLAAGQPAPFCIKPFSFDDWPSAASNGVTLIAWALLLGWVWVGSGADLLGRMAPVFTTPPIRKRPYSPASVRVAMTLILAATALGALAGSRTLPPEGPRICSAG